ncbi:MAG: radical SAM protein [Candidatus Aenigmatarchaeota archaeon]
MSDIVLINPSYTKLHQGWIEEVAKGSEPFLGIAYIASTLENKGFEVKILDALAEGCTKADIEDYIKKENPKIVGITVTTPMVPYAFDIADMAKRFNKDIRVVFGGAHPSALPEETLESSKSVDFCVIGEGEITFLELCDALLITQAKLSDIKGIAFRDKDKIVRTHPRPFVENLDDLPFPARHLLPMDKYSFSPIKFRRSPGTNMLASRGCPYNCLFCTKHVFGQRLRVRSVSNVIEEIKQLQDKYGIKEIHFYDDTFTMNEKFVEEFCESIKKEKIDISFWVNGRVNTVNKKMLTMLKEAGCYRIYFGFESATLRILKILNKQETIEQSIEASKMTRDAGIDVYGFFILGSPTETVQEMNDTIEFAKKYCDYAHFTSLTPYPGTKLWESAKEYGTMSVKGWDDFVQIAMENPLFVPNSLKKEELVAALDRAYKAFMFRPAFVSNILKEIWYQPSKIITYSKGLFKMLTS